GPAVTDRPTHPESFSRDHPAGSGVLPRPRPRVASPAETTPSTAGPTRTKPMKQALKYIGVFILWNLVAGTALLLGPPLVALPVSLGVSALLLWGYLLRPAGEPGAARRWAALRLRPLRGEALTWTIAAIPVVLVLAWAV